MKVIYLSKKVAHVLIAGAILLCICFPMALLVNKVHAAPESHIWFAQVGAEFDQSTIEGMNYLPGEFWINQGDSIVWKAKSAEVHTITFLKKGQGTPIFNEQDPLQTIKQGSNNYDGQSYYNSGLLSNASMLHLSTSYALRFTTVGDFTYICLLHPSMIGIIHVRPFGSPYPFLQKDYDQQIARGEKVVKDDGDKLAKEAKEHANKHTIIVGIGDGLVTDMRYYPGSNTIHVGETVTFVNMDTMEPHTVTFGTEEANIFAPYGNAKAYDGKEQLNSGYLGYDPHWFGLSFKVTFTRAGTFIYHCALHDYMGMTGKIIVKA
jgi:plastocyanin